MWTTRPKTSAIRHAAIWLFLMLSACARPLPPSLPEPLSDCVQVLSHVDTAVNRSESADTAAFRIDGYPFLRSDRFLARIAVDAATTEQQSAWLNRLHRLDLDARRKEAAVLEPRLLKRLARNLGIPADREFLMERTIGCSGELYMGATENPDLVDQVAEAIRVPTEYAAWQRWLGLYPLAAIPVTAVSNKVFHEFRERHRTPLADLPVEGRRLAYVPKGEPPSDTEDIRLQPIHRDSLEIPLVSPAEARQLALRFAPNLVQDTVGGYDRIGRIRWSGETPQVDTRDPTAYYYLSFALLDRRPVLQINYTFWYPARNGSRSPWFERGPLDGLTVRISLDIDDPDGRPFMMDVMNNCGCYHFFVPDHHRVTDIRNPAWGPATLIPSWLPEGIPEQRVRLYVNSGWHQVDHIAAGDPSEPGIGYRLRDYRELEMLPDGAGGARSLFNEDGIAFGSPRIEPLFFFSMGIPSVGSMRQRGHHAIKFVGREHFDDPELFNRWFSFQEPPDISECDGCGADGDSSSSTVE